MMMWKYFTYTLKMSIFISTSLVFDIKAFHDEVVNHANEVFTLE